MTSTSELKPCTAPNLLPNISAAAEEAAQVIETSSIDETNRQIELVKQKKELLFLQMRFAETKNKWKEQRKAIDETEDSAAEEGEEEQD